MRPSKLAVAGLSVCLLVIVPPVHGDKLPHYIQAKAALERAKIDLGSAVEQAMGSAFGATLIETVLLWQADALVYEVEYFIGLELTEIEIDAHTGQVRSTSKLAMNPSDEEYAALRKAASSIKTSPAETLKLAARAATGAQPYRITYKMERGQPTYEVDLLDNGKQAKVLVDAVNGKTLDVDIQRVADVTATWDFDGRKARGKLPKGWRARPAATDKPTATWRVVRDQDAPSRPNVLALTKSESEEQTFNLAMAERTSYQNVDLRVRVKAVAGELDQGGGPIWRCRDESNYYICRFNPLEGNYRVYKVVDGQRRQLLSADVETEAGHWYLVRIVMRGDRIVCFLDGQRLLRVTDDTFKSAGMIGLWTKADAVTSFDDLSVTVP